MSLAFCFTSRASSRIAVFLPSKLPATSVARSSACFASSPIRSSSCSRSPSRSSSLLTLSVAPWAAIARPITSPSFDSRFVSSAIVCPFRWLLASLEPSHEQARKALLAHLGLRLPNRIFNPVERRKPPFEVEHEPGSARIAVARLANRARVEDPASVQLHLRARPCGAARNALTVEFQGERHVAVAHEHQRRGGQVERGPRRFFGEDVFPDRVARACMKEIDAF